LYKNTALRYLNLLLFSGDVQTILEESRAGACKEELDQLSIKSDSVQKEILVNKKIKKFTHHLPFPIKDAAENHRRKYLKMDRRSQNRTCEITANQAKQCRINQLIPPH
jgi:hypothetical protein